MELHLLHHAAEMNWESLILPAGQAGCVRLMVRITSEKVCQSTG